MSTTELKPWKCPACDGWGRRWDRHDRRRRMDKGWVCSACGGVGVLWSPKEYFTDGINAAMDPRPERPSTKISVVTAMEQRVYEARERYTRLTNSLASLRSAECG